MNVERREVLRLGAGLTASAFLGGCATAQAPQFVWSADHGRRLSAADRARLRGVIETSIAEERLLGAVTAIADSQGVLLLDARGRADAASGAPLSDDAIFRMMSSTKPVTAVAVLTLVDQGKLSIDDPVSRFLPTFANPRVAIAPDGWEAALADPSRRSALAEQVRFVAAEREITIKDLLTHTSGIASSGPAALVNPPEAPAPTTSLAEYIPSLGASALNFQPGARWSYSAQHGMDILLRIVEIVSGQEAEAYMREHIFDPLGMSDTYFRVPDAKQHRVLKVHKLVDGAWVEEMPKFRGDESATYCSGGGGLLSTIRDFIAFELMLLNDGAFNGSRVLRAETAALMRTDHAGAQFAEGLMPYSRGMGFGLGVAIVLDPAISITGRGRGAFGWGGAYGTESWAEPERGYVACYFIQQLPPRPQATDWISLVTESLA